MDLNEENRKMSVDTSFCCGHPIFRDSRSFDSEIAIDLILKSLVEDTEYYSSPSLPPQWSREKLVSVGFLSASDATLLFDAFPLVQQYLQLLNDASPILESFYSQRVAYKNNEAMVSFGFSPTSLIEDLNLELFRREIVRANQINDYVISLKNYLSSAEASQIAL